jgi:hypothetical protein
MTTPEPDPRTEAEAVLGPVLTDLVTEFPWWIHNLVRIADGWSPSVEFPDGTPYLTIPIGPEWVALEIEQVGSASDQLIMTVRQWDRTHGLSAESHIGEFTPESAELILPIILAGFRAMAEAEEKWDDEIERKSAEDDAAWNTGGYVE